MGRCFTAEAHKTMMRLQQACRAATGSTNQINGHFFEDDGLQHKDDSIRGDINKMLPGNMARKVGEFRITKDGVISKGPKWFKELGAKEVKA